MRKATHKENSQSLYHGTVNIFVPNILKEGLKPIKANRWKIHDVKSGHDPSTDDNDGFVYLAPEKKLAAEFAEAKAQYLKRKSLGAYKPTNFIMLVAKDEDAPVVPDAKPVVLSINIPFTKEWKHTFYADTDCPDAYRFFGTIPPQLITVLE